MKKLLLFASGLLLSVSNMMAQCSDLFISTYVEGYSNNKAIQIYNPTANPINLSGYSVGRYNNGATTAILIPLPNISLAAYDNYVVVLDQRNPTGTGQNYPIWNGYFEIDTIKDAVTGQIIQDIACNTIAIKPKYNTSVPINGTVYHNQLDLQGRGDVFLCPDYTTNSAMYFNGNDAVVLVKGTTVDATGSNIVDAIGVIGEDPGVNGWVDPQGKKYTTDMTIKRKKSVKRGTGMVLTARDTFAYTQWDRYYKDAFCVLDNHPCDCDPSTISVAKPVMNEVDFTIFPNPTSERTVSIVAEENIASIQVFNILGENVLTTIAQGNTDRLDLNLGKIVAGMYIVNIRFANNKQSIEKLILKD